MNDLDLEHDDALAQRIRQTLATVADATPLRSEATVSPLARPSSRPRLLFAAAAAVLAVVVGAGVLVAGREGETAVTNPTPIGEISPLPVDFDAAAAAPIFSAAGDPEAVAQAYLEARFPDFPAPGVTLAMVEESAASAKAHWQTGDDSGVLEEGDLLMRRDADQWMVVASTTDSIDTGSISFDGTTLTGTIRSTSEDSLFADVLDWSEQPVRHAPQPGGASPEMPTFGTAGGPSIGSLDLDIPHPGAPAIVRIRLVGGTVLGITEFRLDPPPLAPHRDFDGCVSANNTREKEPTPDIVARNCAMALQATVISEGDAVDRGWQLVASEEPSGTWVTLRFRDQVGMFRFRADAPAPARDVREDPVESIDVCCGSSTATVMVAVVHHDVSRVRLTTSAGTVVEAEALPNVDRRYAVLVVEPTVEGEEGSLEAQIPNGEWIAVDGSFSLAVLGG